MSSSEPVPESPATAWFSTRFALLLALQFAFGVVFSSFLLLPKYLTVVHRADARVIGQVTGVALLAGVLAVPATGWLLRRFPRPAVAVVGSLLGAVGCFGFVLVTEVSVAMWFLRALQGIAFVLVFNAGGAMVTDLVPPARLGRALGIWGLASLVTNALAPAILEPVATRYGFIPVFHVAGSAGLVAAALSLATFGGEVASHKGPAQLVTTILAPHRMTVFGASALIGAGLGTMFTFIQPFALLRGIPHIATFFVGYTVAAVLARVLLGDVADRWGRARVSALAIVVYGTTVAGTAWLSPSLLALVGVGLGLAHGVAYPALNALAVEGVAGPERGAVMAYYHGAFNVGFALSVTLLGEVARRAGYPIVFLLVGSVVLLGSVRLWWLPAPSTVPARP